MGYILSLLAGYVVRNLGILLTGWKGILLVTFLSFVSINLYNLYCTITQEILNYTLGAVQSATSGTSGPPSTMVQFVGLAGYFASHLRLVECFSFIINITTLKWLVAKIPFMRW